MSDQRVESTIQFYNDAADEYAEKVENIFLVQEFDRFIQDLPPKSLVLDIGCGSGRDALAFTQQGHRLIGIDRSSELLQKAQAHAPNAEFRQIDIMDMNFPPEYFEGIWALACLHHIPRKDLPAVFQNCYRMLKKGGVFYSPFKQGDGENFFFDKRFRRKNRKLEVYYQEQEILDKLGNAGFDVEASYVYTDPSGRAHATHPWMNFFSRKK